MQRRTVHQLCVFLMLAGCASTKVTERETYEGDRLPQPGRVYVEDFTTQPGIAADAEAAQKLGARIAAELAADLDKMGLPAVAVAPGQATPQLDDIVVRGYFVKLNPGSATERVVVGFGEGDAELTTAVEGFQMTPTGLRRLGGGEVASGGGKVPGVLLPLAVVAATGNPVGLIIGGAVKAHGEISGSTTIEGAAKRTADEIVDQMRPTIERQGWKLS